MNASTIAAEKFTFFYHGEFSQWFASRFVIEGVEYNRAEQFMMAEKARLFGDFDVLVEILKSDDPAKQKALGRQVKGFDPETWDLNAKLIVYRGSIAKYSQNDPLFAKLMATDGTTLVEASPRDKIWGIGLDAKDPRALSRDTWNGTNWLGDVLTKARIDLAALQARFKL